MNCRWIQKKLFLYAKGGISPRTAHRIENHLENCAQCRAALEKERELSRALRELPAPPMPDTFRRRLAQTAENLPKRRAFMPLAPVGAVAVVLAAVLVFVGIRYLPGREAAPAPQAAMQEVAADDSQAEIYGAADTGGVTLNGAQAAQGTQADAKQAAESSVMDTREVSRQEKGAFSLRWYYWVISAGCMGIIGLLLWRTHHRHHTEGKE